MRLAGSRDCQRILRDAPANSAACADNRSRANLHRRYKRRIGADEGTGTDICFMFEVAVVIARDCASANIGTCAHMRIADIGQMIGFGPCLNCRGLDLNEVANARALTNVGTWAQASRSAPASSAATRSSACRSGRWRSGRLRRGSKGASYR